MTLLEFIQNVRIRDIRDKQEAIHSLQNQEAQTNNYKILSKICRYCTVYILKQPFLAGVSYHFLKALHDDNGVEVSETFLKYNLDFFRDLPKSLDYRTEIFQKCLDFSVEIFQTCLDYSTEIFQKCLDYSVGISKKALMTALRSSRHAWITALRSSINAWILTLRSSKNAWISALRSSKHAWITALRSSKNAWITAYLECGVDVT